MKKTKIIIPDAAPLVTSLSDAVLKELTDHRWKVFTRDMTGYGRNFTIRKGNFLLGILGCNRFMKLAVYPQGNDLAAELKCSFLGSHITLLIMLLLMIPPLHIGLVFALTPIGWIFIAAHLLGFALQITALLKMRKFITAYCARNNAVPLYCPQCGKSLDPAGKCSHCQP